MISWQRIDSQYFRPDTWLMEMWGFIAELKVMCSLWCCPPLTHPPWSIVVPAHLPWLILMRLTEPRPLSAPELFRKGIIKLEDWRAPYCVRKVKGSVSGFFLWKVSAFTWQLSHRYSLGDFTYFSTTYLIPFSIQHQKETQIGRKKVNFILHMETFRVFQAPWQVNALRNFSSLGFPWVPCFFRTLNIISMVPSPFFTEPLPLG